MQIHVRIHCHTFTSYVRLRITMIVVLFLVGPVGAAWDDSLEHEQAGDGSDDEPVGLESRDTPEDE
jgi:hypothetical protein